MKGQKIPTAMQEKGRVYFAILPKNRPLPDFDPTFPYRFAISDRNDQGEPTYEYVPPFLKQPLQSDAVPLRSAG